MKVELKANGKTVRIEMAEEQLKELGVLKPKTGYERRKEYYLVNAEGLVIEEKDTILFDQNCYEVGNFYNDKVIAENNARADRLQRCLRQWQAQNDEVISKEDWEDHDLTKYFIIYDYDSNVISPGRTWWMRGTNNIYFKSREKAEEAIEAFRDELLWYFTEYVQRLDEAQNG